MDNPEQDELESWYQNDASLYEEIEACKHPAAMKDVVTFWLETSEAEIDLSEIDWEAFYCFVKEI